MIVPESWVCHQCPTKVHVFFDAKAWCREHFLAEVAVRDDARAERLAAG